MSQHWSPMSQVTPSTAPGQWFMFEEGARIAIIRRLEIGAKKETMFRVVTYTAESADRALIGYFPHLPMAAEVTWREYLRAKQRR